MPVCIQIKDRKRNWDPLLSLVAFPHCHLWRQHCNLWKVLELAGAGASVFPLIQTSLYRIPSLSLHCFFRSNSCLAGPNPPKDRLPKVQLSSCQCQNPIPLLKQCSLICALPPDWATLEIEVGIFQPGNSSDWNLLTTHSLWNNPAGPTSLTCA